MMEGKLNRRMFDAVEVRGFECSVWEVIMITEVTGTVEKGAL
jgi:hypothetical protein